MAKTKSMSNEKLLQDISKVFDEKIKETKKDNKALHEETKRHFGVVAEGLEKQISAIAEQHGTLVKNQEGIKSELEGVKLAVLDNRVAIEGNRTVIEKIDQKLDSKLENHEERMVDIEHKVGIA